MLEKPRKNRKSECSVCYLVHDEEIHEATLRIHRWFFKQVTHDFVDDSYFAAEAAPVQTAG
jgi:hypothetical protein